jgi:hypothetical protein
VAEDGLIVQRLDDELLVYDTTSNEAHVLGGAVAAEFDAAADEVSRREVIRRLALVGAAAAGATPFVKTIIAPAPAEAQSAFCAGLPDNTLCTPDGNVCTNDLCSGGVCTHPPVPNGTTCGTGVACCNGACIQANSCG